MDTYPDAQPIQQMFSGSADFFMYEFKIVPCTLPHSHDWSSCPYVHRNEKARRRNPKHFSYAAIPCPVDRKGTNCPRGDACPYSHNVYEYWLHPDRFRTQMCRDGKQCNRPLCFFAHERSELRQPPLRPPMDALVDQQQQHHHQDGMGPPGIPNEFLDQFQQLGVQQQQQQPLQQQPMRQLQHPQQQALAVGGGPLGPMQQQVQYLPAQPGMMVPVIQASSGPMGVMPYPAPGAMGAGGVSMAYAPSMPGTGATPAGWPVWDSAPQQQQPQHQGAAGYSSAMLHQPWSQAQAQVVLGGPGAQPVQQQQPQQQQGMVITNQQQHQGILMPALQQQHQLQQGVPGYHLMQQQQQPVAIQQQPQPQQQQQLVMVVSAPVEVGLQANLGAHQVAATAGLALPINQHLAAVGSPGAPGSNYGSPVAAASDGLSLSSSLVVSGVSPPASRLQLQGSGGSGSYAGSSSHNVVQLPVCSGLDPDHHHHQQQQQYAYLGLQGDPMPPTNSAAHASSSGMLQGLQLVDSSALVGSPAGPGQAASTAAAGAAAAAAAVSTADPRLLLSSWSDAAVANAGLLVTTAGFGY